MVRQKKHLKEKNNCFVLVRNDVAAQRKREGEGKRARERERERERERSVRILIM